MSIAITRIDADKRFTGPCPDLYAKENLFNFFFSNQNCKCLQPVSHVKVRKRTVICPVRNGRQSDLLIYYIYFVNSGVNKNVNFFINYVNMLILIPVLRKKTL